MGVSQRSFSLCVGNDHLHSWKDLQQQTAISQITFCSIRSQLLVIYMMTYLPRLHQWQAVWRPSLYQANPEENKENTKDKISNFISSFSIHFSKNVTKLCASILITQCITLSEHVNFYISKTTLVVHGHSPHSSSGAPYLSCRRALMST